MNKLKINKNLIYILLLIILLFIIIYKIYNSSFEKFNNLYGNIIYNGNNDIILLNDKGYISGFIVNINNINDNDDKYFKIKFDNEYLNIDDNDKLLYNKYYDMNDLNIVTDNIIIEKSDKNNIIKKIKIYGILNNDNKLDIPTVNINNELKSITVNFNKIKNVTDIISYLILIVKYNHNKEFIYKKIINLDSGYVNFNAEIMNILTNNNLNITETSDLLDIYNISSLEEYKKKKLYKLIIKNKYNKKQNNEVVVDILNELNEISTLKFNIPDSIDDFIESYNENIYYYQSYLIKDLLKYLYNLLKNNCLDNDNICIDNCNLVECSYTFNNLENMDIYNNKYYYKIGIGYYRLNEKGEEIMSNIRTYVDNNGNKLLTLLDEDNKKKNSNNILMDDYNIYNNLTDISDSYYDDVRSGVNSIGSNYPSNFYISSDDENNNLNNNICLKDYIDKSSSPIKININT